MATHTRIDVEGYTYEHQSGSENLELTKYIGTDVDVVTPIIESLNSVTITVIPTPDDAIVTLTATGYTQDNNSITVPINTQVTYQISRIGYQSSTPVTITATEDQTILANPLVPIDYTLTINPHPADATVTLTAVGYTQVGNHITVPYGTTVFYQASKLAYNTTRGLITVNDNISLDVNLVKAGSAAKFMNYGTCVVCFQTQGTRIFDLEYVYNPYTEHYDYGTNMTSGYYDEHIDCGGLDE